MINLYPGRLMLPNLLTLELRSWKRRLGESSPDSWPGPSPSLCVRVCGWIKCYAVYRPRSLITLGHPWTWNVTHVTLDTRLPLFSLARALKKIGEPGDEATLLWPWQCYCTFVGDHKFVIITVLIQWMEKMEPSMIMKQELLVQWRSSNITLCLGSWSGRIISGIIYDCTVLV